MHLQVNIRGFSRHPSRNGEMEKEGVNSTKAYEKVYPCMTLQKVFHKIFKNIIESWA
jgi:hypothetical protein